MRRAGPPIGAAVERRQDTSVLVRVRSIYVPRMIRTGCVLARSLAALLARSVAGARDRLAGRARGRDCGARRATSRSAKVRAAACEIVTRRRATRSRARARRGDADALDSHRAQLDRDAQAALEARLIRAGCREGRDCDGRAIQRRGRAEAARRRAGAVPPARRRTFPPVRGDSGAESQGVAAAGSANGSNATSRASRRSRPSARDAFGDLKGQIESMRVGSESVRAEAVEAGQCAAQRPQGARPLGRAAIAQRARKLRPVRCRRFPRRGQSSRIARAGGCVPT